MGLSTALQPVRLSPSCCFQSGLRKRIVQAATPHSHMSVSSPLPTPQQAAAGVLKHRCTSGLCRASSEQSEQQPSPAKQPQQPNSTDNSQLLYTLGIGALAAGLYAYAFMYSPNQTPYRDQIFLARLVGVGDDGFVVNQVFASLFNIMGVYPAIYASLLIPAARSENKLPAWPFVSLSFLFGVFALLPYMVLWRPKKDNQLPPPKEELEGWNRLFMKGAETPVLPALLLLAAGYQIYLAATAGGEAWAEYFKLFDESRFVHVTSLDFATLTALAPFWMSNDAELRSWQQRDKFLPVLSYVPVVGPIIYLLLRPKTDMSSAPKQ